MSVALYTYLMVSAAFLLIVAFAGWMLRSYSHISIYNKSFFVVMLAAFAVAAPYLVYSVLGSPTLIKFSKLPKEIQLLGVTEYKQEVFIWLRTPENQIPINYEVVELTQPDRKLLAEAAKMLKKGKQVFLQSDKQGEGGEEGKGGEEGEGGKGGKGEAKKGKNKDGIETDSEEESQGYYHINKERVFPPKQDADSSNSD